MTVAAFDPAATELAAMRATLETLDAELVGLEPVKRRIREIAALLVVDRLRRDVGLAADRPSLHMSFTGEPGTGKTTVALRMAEILHQLGYLERGHLVAVTRDDLVGQYVGHTAPKTREVLKRAAGGVLFIDEAYYLHRPENERDYGQEAIEILLQVMENDRDRVVVILAGYADRMDRFFRSNPGLRSRVAHHVDFPTYSDEQLLAIARVQAEQQSYTVGEETQRALREYIALRRAQPQFAHAVDAQRRRSGAPAARDAAAGGRGPFDREHLAALAPEDFRRFSVFDRAA